MKSTKNQSFLHDGKPLASTIRLHLVATDASNVYKVRNWMMLKGKMNRYKIDRVLNELLACLTNHVTV